MDENQTIDLFPDGSKEAKYIFTIKNGFTTSSYVKHIFM